ncbi:hypothetical protein [Paractinoplanes maris]|uniref:hypothetical protein n=1 Tax=Paractinoplanes maris TaxID=1734446 RepID=UPI0020215C9B|nr:hypothetical protein [Actinoplanes maris]
MASDGERPGAGQQRGAETAPAPEAAQRSGAAERPAGLERGPRPESKPEAAGWQPTPEFQQKLDDFTARKEAKQDAGQYVDHRPAKAEAAVKEAAAGPDGGRSERRDHDAKHFDPAADLRGKGTSEPDTPGERPHGSHYRGGSEGAPREAQRQGIREAVTQAKADRLENAVTSAQAPPDRSATGPDKSPPDRSATGPDKSPPDRNATGPDKSPPDRNATGPDKSPLDRSVPKETKLPEPIVVIGSDPLFKGDYLDVVRGRMSENDSRDTYRMRPQDIVDANHLSPEQFAAMREQGARFIDLGDGDPDIVDPVAKSVADNQRAQLGARAPGEGRASDQNTYEHYLPVYESYAKAGDLPVTGDMQKQRVEPAADHLRAELRAQQAAGRDVDPSRVHTYNGPHEATHKPAQMAMNIAWTGQIAIGNPGRMEGGEWKPDTSTVGYSPTARQGPQGEFTAEENRLHKSLGSWRQFRDPGDGAVDPNDEMR